MSYIFLDESGCLGFDFTKSKTSKYFLITFLFADNKRPLEKMVRNVFKSMPEKQRQNHCGVLHCNKEQPKIRMKLFNELKEANVSIMTIRLNKKKVFTKFHNEQPILYNYVTNILLDRILTKKLVPTDQKVHLIASRRETNKLLNDNFKRYLSNNLVKNHKVDIEVIIKTPQQEKGLQLVDAASWAIFRKYEHQDESYYNIFKELIVEENTLF
jgi:hypothetical protein